jgi:hypothetical protein
VCNERYHIRVHTDNYNTLECINGIKKLKIIELNPKFVL